MAYHTRGNSVYCVRCQKPMAEWKVGDICLDKRGHVGPSSPPSNFNDEGFWYQCDNCDHREESGEEISHQPCSKCKTGILHLCSPPTDIGSMGI